MCTDRARHGSCWSSRGMNTFLLGALVAGLSGSPHCVGMCGGFASAASEGPVPWHLGRGLAYVGLGVLAGAVGDALPGPGWLGSLVAAALLAWFSLRLAGVVSGGHLGSGLAVRWGAHFARTPGWWGTFGFGAAMALLPCGLLWAALGLAVGSGTAVGGGAAMLAFWSGTIPLLAGLSGSVQRLASRGPWARRSLAGLVFVSGMWSIVQRFPAGDEDGEPPACHQP